MSFLSGLTNIVGGIIGGNAAQSEMQKAEDLLNAGIKRIEGLQVPDLTKDLLLQQFMETGDYSPQHLENLVDKFAPAALITEPPENRLRQLDTYAQVKQVTLSGLSPQDKLGIEEIRKKAAQDVMSQIASGESAFKQRGQFGSGQQYAGQLLASQGAANRASSEGMEIAAKAMQNKQNALQNMIGLGENIRQQDLSLAERNQQAINEHRLFSNKYMSERSGNVWANKNKLAAEQRGYKQDLSRSNTEMANAEARRKGYEAPMKMFDMLMGKEKARANLEGSLADLHVGRGQAKAQMWSDIGAGAGKMVDPISDYMKSGGGGGGGGGFGGNPLSGGSMKFTTDPALMANAASIAASDVKLKENIEHIGNDDFTGLPIYDFNYKGNGDRYRGVIAQDVEKVMPDAVTERNGVKYVDYNKLGMKMFKLT